MNNCTTMDEQVFLTKIRTLHSDISKFLAVNGDSFCPYFKALSKSQRKRIVDFRIQKVAPSLLCEAVKKQRMDIVEFFLDECNASVDVTSLLVSYGDDLYQQVTPLCLASYQDDVDIMEVLLRHGADVNYKNDFGWTPLSFAGLNGNRNAFSILLQHEASVNVIDDNGGYILSQSCNFPEICENLLESDLVKFTDLPDLGKKALQETIRKGNLKSFELFHKHGVDLCCVLENGLSVIQTAALSKREDIMFYLLKSCQYCTNCVIQAHELIGIGKVTSYEIHNLKQCADFWKRALQLRTSTEKKTVSGKQKQNSEEAKHQRTCCINTCIQDSNEFVFKASELTTVQEIDTLLATSEASTDDTGFFVQSVMILQRHFGSEHEATCDYGLRYLAECYCCEKATDFKGFPLYMHCYSTYLKNPARNAWRSISFFVVTQIATVLFTCRKHLNLNNYMTDSAQERYAKSILSLDNLLDIFEIIVEHLLITNQSRNTCLTRYVTSVCWDQLPYLAHDITFLACEAKVNMLEIDSKQKRLMLSFEKLLRKVVTIHISLKRGESLLHLPVVNTTGTRYYECAKLLNSSSVVAMFIECGAGVDIQDDDGNTPLMRFLLRENLTSYYRDNAIVQKLTEGGSHIDIFNKAGQRPMDLLSRLGHNVCTVKHRSLQCIAATAVATYNIAYQTLVPNSIKKFIDLHNASWDLK